MAGMRLMGGWRSSAQWSVVPAALDRFTRHDKTAYDSPLTPR